MKFSLLGLLLMTMAQNSYAQFAFTPISDPDATGGTVAQGISGNDIVGYYTDSSGYNVHGFLYNGSTYVNVDDPNATENNPNDPNGTYVSAIYGNTIVGDYWVGRNAHGFIENGGIYTTFDDPNTASETVPTGIFGNTIVGYFETNTGGDQGFIDSNGSFTTVGNPFYTYLTGISGSTIVGNYGPYPPVPFTYSGGTFTTISDLNNPYPPGYINANGISGNDIVGGIVDGSGSHGFLYNGTTFTIFDDPAVTSGTYATGISGNEIVGAYSDASGNTYSFLAVEAPEPSTCPLLLSGLGVVYFFYRRQQAKRETYLN
jgi:hypothetical protein